MKLTLEQLRRYAIARSLFKPTSLGRAIRKLGFVQADPIRAPARAQDLTLRHRVIGYCAGDLERRYARLKLEEEFFVNYGFLSRAHQALLHPRQSHPKWKPARGRHIEEVLAFVRERGSVHPRAVDAHFAHGKVTNWFGGSSNATTQLLDAMHYRGLLRVARREGGTRIYAVREPAAAHALGAEARLDTLVDLIVRKYAPLPASSLNQLVYRLRAAAPQWQAPRRAAFARATQRLARVRIEGVEWYWPANETPQSRRWQADDAVRLLTPFDPVVWDRRRFELFWGWRYRFEAYTPAAKRKLGYYALPLLWRERVIGWGNVSVAGGTMRHTLGYVDGDMPRSALFRAELHAELARLRNFLKSEVDLPRLEDDMAR